MYVDRKTTKIGHTKCLCENGINNENLRDWSFKLLILIVCFCNLELMEKSVEELKDIIHEFNLQANIYSELLLSELNYREKLTRDREVKNNFIASFLAVERKVNDDNNRKKKTRYGFFKNIEEESKVCQ